MSVLSQLDIQDQPIPQPESLVEVTRGSLVESRHRGHIVVVTPDGNIITYLGNPKTITFLRSSAKPHQALPLIISGAADHFAFTQTEIALACASHSGEPIHTEIVTSMLEKIDLSPGALKCGTHEPFSPEATQRLRKTGEAPNVLQNNCSGKHAAMLALARHLGAPIETYDSPDHPVQLAIKEIICEFSGVPMDKIVTAVDGCGVPVFGIPVNTMASMYAKLVEPPPEFDKATRDACERVVLAMTVNPELIGGSKDRLDTEIMRAGNGELVSKVGAEGVYTLGVLPNAERPRALGLAIKIEDGDDHRARPTVVIECLRQLGIIRNESLKALCRYATFDIRNHNGESVGTVQPAFELPRTRDLLSDT